MDTSKEYLTMIYEAWDDLVELWTPCNTDWVARKGTCDQVLQDFLQEYIEERMIVKNYEDNKVAIYGWHLSTFDKHELACALRQDQIQEMLKFDVGSFDDNFWSALSDLNEWDFFGKFTIIPVTMEQLWLRYLMHTRFNKIWDGSNGWMLEECPLCGKLSPNAEPHTNCMVREQYLADRKGE